jgi:hypothetical protein
MSVKKLLAYFASGMLQLRRPRHGRPVFAWGITVAIFKLRHHPKNKRVPRIVMSSGHTQGRQQHEDHGRERSVGRDAQRARDDLHADFLTMKFAINRATAILF